MLAITTESGESFVDLYSCPPQKKRAHGPIWSGPLLQKLSSANGSRMVPSSSVRTTLLWFRYLFHRLVSIPECIHPARVLSQSLKPPPEALQPACPSTHSLWSPASHCDHGTARFVGHRGKVASIPETAPIASIALKAPRPKYLPKSFRPSLIHTRVHCSPQRSLLCVQSFRLSVLRSLA